MPEMSKDGTPVREIVAQWLRENHYDGLVNLDGGCGCGFDDLMSCQCVNGVECLCAYETPVLVGNEYYRKFSTSISKQDAPSDTLEKVALDMWEWIDGVTHKHWTVVASDVGVYKTRLKALGVVADA